MEFRILILNIKLASLKHRFRFESLKPKVKSKHSLLIAPEMVNISSIKIHLSKQSPSRIGLTNWALVKVPVRHLQLELSYLVSSVSTPFFSLSPLVSSCLSLSPLVSPCLPLSLLVPWFFLVAGVYSVSYMKRLQENAERKGECEHRLRMSIRTSDSGVKKLKKYDI